MYEKKYDGFIFGTVIFTIAMYFASVLPFFTRLIVSFFIETPHINESHGDASVLFNVVYPIMGVVTIATFLFGSYIVNYFAAYKIAYKARITQPDKKVKMQTTICGIIIFLMNIYSGLSLGFTGMMATQFWYPAAVTASLFGIVDKHNLLREISQDDIRVNNFVITGINSKIIAVILVYAVLLSVLFIYFSYKGRKSGEAYGLESIQKYINSVKNSDPTVR